MESPCRREFLATAGAVTGVILAGCSFGSSTGPAEDSGSELGWADWLPASEFSDDATVVHYDISAARDELPEDVLNEFHTDGFADSLGIGQEELSDVIRLEAQSQLRAGIFSAPITPDELIEQIETTEDDVESYNGYEIVELPQRENIALHDSGVILASSPKRYIDAKAGETARAFEQQTPARETLSRVAAAPFSAIVPGDERTVAADLSVEPNWRGVGVRAQSDETPIVLTHFRFGSADEAASALEELEGEFQGSLTNPESNSQIELSRDGRYVVTEIESGSLSLSLLFP